jgi:hypothetical protein
MTQTERWERLNSDSAAQDFRYGLISKRPRVWGRS